MIIIKDKDRKISFEKLLDEKWYLRQSNGRQERIELEWGGNLRKPLACFWLKKREIGGNMRWSKSITQKSIIITV